MKKPPRKPDLVRDPHEPSRPDKQPYATEVEDYSGERSKPPAEKGGRDQSPRPDPSRSNKR